MRRGSAKDSCALLRRVQRWLLIQGIVYRQRDRNSRSFCTPRAGRVFLQNRRKQMRQTVIVAATTALVTAIVAIWGTTIIIAHTEKDPEAATASTSVDVLKMMRDAKGLPEEQFDAH